MRLRAMALVALIALGCDGGGPTETSVKQRASAKRTAGGPPTPVVPAKETVRPADRDILTIVAQDLLDPDNPEHQLDPAAKLVWPREIVVNSTTLTLGQDRIGDDTLHDVAAERRLSAQLAANWKLRNSREAVPTSHLMIQNSRVRIAKVDDLAGEASAKGLELYTLFNSRYPDASYFFCPYLPGYSDDGHCAIVVLYAGPSIHGVVWLYYIELGPRSGWKIVWRSRRIWE